MHACKAPETAKEMPLAETAKISNINYLIVGGEVGFEPTVRLPVQRFSSSKILVLACAAL